MKSAMLRNSLALVQTVTAPASRQVWEKWRAFGLTTPGGQDCQLCAGGGTPLTPDHGLVQLAMCRPVHCPGHSLTSFEAARWLGLSSLHCGVSAAGKGPATTSNSSPEEDNIWQGKHMSRMQASVFALSLKASKEHMVLDSWIPPIQQENTFFYTFSECEHAPLSNQRKKIQPLLAVHILRACRSSSFTRQEWLLPSRIQDSSTTHQPVASITPIEVFCV